MDGESKNQPIETNVVSLDSRRSEKKLVDTAPLNEPVTPLSFNIRNLSEIAIILGLFQDQLGRHDIQINEIISILKQHQESFIAVMDSLEEVKDVFKTVSEVKNTERMSLLGRIEVLEKEIELLKIPFWKKLLKKLK